MSHCAFFSYSEADREHVLMTYARACNPGYSGLSSRVQSLLTRWDTTDRAVIRQAISRTIHGASRTIVFVGEYTHRSYWVPEEVRMTLEDGKPVYAIRVPGSNGLIPDVLSARGIYVYPWGEATLQRLATM